MQEYLQQRNIPQIPHPPYSPDLARDFWLFRQMTHPLRGRHFESVDELVNAASAFMCDLEKDGLLPVFENWCSRIEKCINIGGGYVEKE